MEGEADFAAVAAVMGHPARAAMLTALLSGEALPASELARQARVAAPTASGHLAQLTAAGLVRVERDGRHRYHRLAGADVAHAIEALSALAPTVPVRSLRASNRMAAHRAARSCYDHLAGQLGVAVTERLCTVGGLDADTLTLRDPAPFLELGVALPETRAGRRPLTRSCLDWSERRPHLAGALGAATLERLLAAGWVARRPQGRALALTAAGSHALERTLGLDAAAVAPGALAA